MTWHLKLAIAVFLAVSMIHPANAAGSSNVTLLYGWNGTNFVPLLTDANGTLLSSLNTTDSIGLYPDINNTYDIGSASKLWANLYVRSIRGGSGPLSLFAGESERITLLANNNVGIGTTSPNATLHVASTSVTGALRITNASNNLEVFFVNTSSGNVGIGTTSPAKKLHVYGADGDNLMRLEGNGEYLDVTNRAEFNLFRLTGSGVGMDFITTSGGSWAAGGGYIRFSPNTAEAMRITTGGNVGIGTTSPSAGLQINRSNPTLRTNGSVFIDGRVGIGTESPDFKTQIGVSSITTFGYPLLLLETTGTVGQMATIGFGRDNGIGMTATAEIGYIPTSFASYGKGSLVFATRDSEGQNDIPTERMRIDSSGNVGIGTTAPLAKLEVNGTNTVNNLSLSVNGSLYVNSSGNVGIGDTAPGAKFVVEGVNSANNLSVDLDDVFYINGSNVGIGTTAPTEILTVVKADDETFLGLSGASGSYTSMAIGRTAAEARLAIAAVAGQWSTNAVAGDAVLRVDDSTKKLHFLAGAGTEVMTITSSSVGIGDTSPQAKFVVEGVNSTNNLSLDVDDVLYVNQSSVGIGTTAPKAKLQIGNAPDGITAETDGFSVRSSSTANNRAVVFEQASAVSTNEALVVGHMSSTATTRVFGVFGGNGAADAFANYRFIVLSGGNVGIGTTSPSAGLQINTSNPTLRTNGSVFIDGNVGIGTTNPRAALEVYDSALIISKPTGTDKNWRFLPSDTTAGDLAIQQSATSGGIDFAAKVTFGATGSVGIGTTSPQRGLHLNGSNSVGSPEFVISNTDMVSGGRNFNIEADTTGTDFWALRTLTDDFIAQNTMFMSFQTGTGNIGIGTTAPSTALDIRRNGTLNLMVGNTNNTLGDVGQIAEIILNPATQLYGTTEAPRIYGYQEEASPYKAGIWFDTYAGGGIRSTRMVIQGNGNVGIGGTDASYQLSITEASGAGAFQASSAQNILALYNSNDNNNNWANMVFRFGPSGIIGGVIGVNSDNTGAGLGALHFATRDGTSLAQRMVISNSGNVGIGTTSPSAGLQINTSNPTLRTNGTVTIDGVLTIRDDINQFNKVMTGGNSGPSGNTGIQSFVAYDLNNNDEKNISSSGGLYFIYDSGDATKYAVISYSGSTVAAISTGSSVSTTKDTSSKINIYAENSKLVVQNKLGSLTTPFIYRFG
ncbi:MAG: hypothetical protein QT00_C0001G0151 [archaeon GW2011_AR5]|nr:MAG: hypothetical protein QT00_C0001G0151 [archaeon GW2011_AR5]